MIHSARDFRQSYKVHAECKILTVPDYAMTNKSGILGYGGSGDYVDLNGSENIECSHSIGGLSDRHQLQMLEPQLNVPVQVLRQYAAQLGQQVLTAENLVNVKVQDVALSWGGWTGPEVVASRPRALASLLIFGPA